MRALLRIEKFNLHGELTSLTLCILSYVKTFTRLVEFFPRVRSLHEAHRSGFLIHIKHNNMTNNHIHRATLTHLKEVMEALNVVAIQEIHNLYKVADDIPQHDEVQQFGIPDLDMIHAICEQVLKTRMKILSLMKDLESNNLSFNGHNSGMLDEILKSL